MKKFSLTTLFSFIIGTELIGVLSSIVSGSDFRTFYDSLVKPPFAPSGWVFPVAWIILYALMGISASLVYQADEGQKTSEALKIYGIQLLVNFLWSPIFFRLKALGISSAVIVILLVLVVIMTVKFFRIRKISAYLNILWVMFATYLNIGFLLLNRK